MPGITFEPVDNHYEWGTYFEFKVLIMSRNGYINATKMCQDDNKQFRFWLQNDSSKELLDELERSENIPSDLVMIKIGTGSNDYRGTYVHPDLVPSIAGWISAAFALKVNRIVNEYRLKEEKKLIAEKDDKISKLEAKLDAILKDTGKILKCNEDLADEMSKLSLDNQITHEKLDDVQGSLDGVQNTLDIVVEDRVVRPKDEGVMNILVIYESVDQGPNMFYIFRVQKRGLKAALKRYKADNPNAIKFYEIEYNPNSINYFIRFKEKLKDNVKWHYNSFELLNITKDQLREFITKVNNEKYELENCK
ncbi:hypothetical protein Unana1_08951 [Umbelopsis nana]